MNKNFWIICAIVFVFITTFVLALDTPSVRRVKISNKDIHLENESTEFVNKAESVNLNTDSSGISNSKISINNSDVDIKSDESVDIYNSSVGYNNYDNNLNNQTTEFGSTKSTITFKNLDDSELDRALEMAKEIDKISSQPPKKRVPQYMYQNIDWNTWKSNFVNRILEDSLSIHQLDSYKEGNWFSYSFIVDKDGKISNISVTSMFLSQEDKERIVDLIQSYQYSEITKFPANTNRKNAKVSAIIILSNTTKKSNPSDFSDTERIKVNVFD